MKILFIDNIAQIILKKKKKIHYRTDVGVEVSVIFHPIRDNLQIRGRQIVTIEQTNRSITAYQRRCYTGSDSICKRGGPFYNVDTL